MDFLVKKTFEFSDSELEEINDLFNEVFIKNRSLNEMINLYSKNPLGYCYHSIIVEDNKIVGMNVFVPYYYKVNGERTLFANSIDSMIKKGYRDFFNFIDLINTGYEYLKREGVAIVYGFPNDNAYPLLTQSGLMKEVGKMYTYCLPYRIGGINKRLSFLNWVSSFTSSTWVKIISLLANNKQVKKNVVKELESFNKVRYPISDKGYKITNTHVYKILEFKGIRTAFLIDVFYKSSKNFCIAVDNIINNDSDNFDILVYPGYINNHYTGLFRIPHKFEPKRFSLCIRVLDESYDDEKLWNIKNWDINLSNFDLV